MRVATRLLLVALLVPNATLAAQQLFREPLDPWSLPAQALTDPWEKLGVQGLYATMQQEMRLPTQHRPISEDASGVRVDLLNPGTLRTRYSKDRAPVPRARRRGTSVGEYVAIVARVFSGFDLSRIGSGARRSFLRSLLTPP